MFFDEDRIIKNKTKNVFTLNLSENLKCIIIDYLGGVVIKL